MGIWKAPHREAHVRLTHMERMRGVWRRERIRAWDPSGAGSGFQVAALRVGRMEEEREKSKRPGLGASSGFPA